MPETETVTADTVRRRVLDILAERPNVRNPRSGSGCAYVADPFSAWEDGTPHAPRCVVGEYLVRFEGWTDADFAAADNETARALIGEDLPADVVAVLQNVQEIADGMASKDSGTWPPLWDEVRLSLFERWGMA
jgi:hypothetical protein